MKNQPADERIDRAIEGLLTSAELDQFKADVIREADLRAAYVDRQWLHASLRAQRATLLDVLVEEPASGKVVRRWPLAVWTAAAAAGITLAVSAWTFGKGTLFHRPVATLVQAENCKWAGSELPTAVNSKLGAGTLSLVEGIATLKFKSGATVTLEAPTKLLIRDAMHCRLIEGTVTAEVPVPAHGFTIDTPDLKVVDLGTRFGVTAGSTGNSQVRVFQGEVEVGGRDRELQRLTEGKGLNVSSGNTAAGQEPIHGQQVQEADGWTSIPTSFGRGKDGYARRGDNGAPLGMSPLLIVKHTDLAAGRNNERRAVVTFDVSQIPAAKVGEAQIVLDPVPSGFGFSALVPDSHFAIYGITDESLDAWDEKQMRWASMPGCTDDGPNPNQTQRLADFWIPRGGTGGPITVRGDALADFIRHHTNDLVSFLIVRETGESDPNGLAHGFASKEHPTARPPTLRIKLSPQ